MLYFQSQLHADVIAPRAADFLQASALRVVVKHTHHGVASFYAQPVLPQIHACRGGQAQAVVHQCRAEESVLQHGLADIDATVVGWRVKPSELRLLAPSLVARLQAHALAQCHTTLAVYEMDVAQGL